jgi:hypothetical protein
LADFSTRVPERAPSSFTVEWPLQRSKNASLTYCWFPTYLQNAEIRSNSIDRVFAISTLEHVDADSMPDVAAHIGWILRPGGLAVLTVDLFLDLEPFTYRKENRHGFNAKIGDLIRWSGLEMVFRTRAELLRFPRIF